MKKSEILLILIIIIIFIISFTDSHGELIENIQIPVGVGVDIDKTSEYDGHYISPYLSYSFEDSNKPNSILSISKAKTLVETREKRQLDIGKKTIIGLNKLYVFSEDTVRNNLKNILDPVISNPDVNDRAIVVICKGKSEDIFKYQVKGYSNSAEYIEGMVKNLKQYNFFSMQYTIMDIIVRIDAEGRNLVLPYIQITDSGIETTGLAIFKKDKFVGVADITESKIINVLKQNNVKGMLTLQTSPQKYINCFTLSKRNVTCHKKNGKYSFDIDLKLKGNIISNELYKDLYSDKKVLNKFESDMTTYVENLCNESISKICLEYKTDVFGLGKYAAAKYGRETGTDWNEVVCNSPIKVHVKFKVDTEGRGNYQ